MSTHTAKLAQVLELVVTDDDRAPGFFGTIVITVCDALKTVHWVGTFTEHGTACITTSMPQNYDTHVILRRTEADLIFAGIPLGDKDCFRIIGNRSLFSHFVSRYLTRPVKAHHTRMVYKKDIQ